MAESKDPVNSAVFEALNYRGVLAKRLTKVKPPKICGPLVARISGAVVPRLFLRDGPELAALRATVLQPRPRAEA